ncbi:MAG TPA: class I SAM-dependent methyltransferase [Longimicrobium sp.]|jgi:predicted O-methyltransferase YrrM
MDNRFVKAVPPLALPEEWRDGPTYAAVEEITAQLTNPWSVSAEVARVLARIVIADRRTRILEFGAGMSSRILAAALEEVGGGTLTSVEQNPVWCQEAWEIVEKSHAVDAELVPACVRLTVDGRGPYYGYAGIDDLVARRGPYDLVFVDAPVGRYGREGALHAAFDALAPDGLVVLDDSAREREQRVLRRWLTTYPELQLVANDSSVGPGVAILRRCPGRQRARDAEGSLLETWAGGWLDVIRSIPGIREYERAQANLVRSTRAVE